MRKPLRPASASRIEQPNSASSSEEPLPENEASLSKPSEPELITAPAPIVTPEPLGASKEPRPTTVADQSPTTSVEPAEKPASPFVTVKAEAVKASLMGRMVGKIPLLKRTRGKEETPPVPIRQSVPSVPEELRRALKGEVPVDVKVYVTKEGKVGFAELLSEMTGNQRDLANLAVYAARRWEFEPAKEDDRKVPGEMILHFRFGNQEVAKR
jgi:outer membrane biosynthesis protein TonB